MEEKGTRREGSRDDEWRTYECRKEEGKSPGKGVARIKEKRTAEKGVGQKRREEGKGGEEKRREEGRVRGPGRMEARRRG